MRRQGTIVSNFRISMSVAKGLIINNHGQRGGHHLAVIFNAKLPLRKTGDLLTVFGFGQTEQSAQSAIHFLPYRFNILEILWPELTQT